MIGKKGYKKSGFYEGLVGIIERYGWEGFEDRYVIRFSNGAGVVASENDIEVLEEQEG